MTTIVTRAGKGTPLTNTEVDTNFTNLNTDKLELGGTFSSGIANSVLFLNGSKVATSGSVLTFDGTNLFVGTSTNTNSSRIVSAGTISETVNSTQYLVASQFDIGTAANEIPLNQYLGNLAYQDAGSIAGPIGLGGAVTLYAGTANGVPYLNGSKVLTTGSALTFDGTTLVASNLTDSSLTTGRVVYTTTAGRLTDSANLLYSGTDLTVYGITIGRGAGAVSTNTVIGNGAFAAVSATGGNNVAIGQQAMRLTTTGDRNTAVGVLALGANTTGTKNTAVGQLTLEVATTAAENTALGYGALNATTTGQFNTAVGSTALVSNTTASNNTAVGYQALYNNTTGGGNVAIGYLAGDAATTGEFNIAIGPSSLGTGATSANRNVAIGTNALIALTTGSYNTFVGHTSGEVMTTGSKNTVIGAYNGNQGGLDIRTSSNNIVLSDGDGEPRLVYYSAAPMTKISGTLTHNLADVQNKSQVVLYDNTNGNFEVATGYATSDFVVATGGTTGNLAYTGRSNGYFVVNTGVIAIVGTTFTVGSNTYTVTGASSEGYIYCTPDPIGEAATGTLVSVKYATEGFRVLDDRTARFRSTVGVGNALGSTSGAGITFPATQSASSNANTLDDYEQGTFTPTLETGNSVTYTSRDGFYTKVGNTVTVWARIEISAKGASTNEIGIGGLPFASAGTFMSVGSLGRAYSPAGIAPATANGAFFSVEGSIAYPRQPNGGNQGFTSDEFGNSGSLWMAATYRTAD